MFYSIVGISKDGIKPAVQKLCRELNFQVLLSLPGKVHISLLASGPVQEEDAWVDYPSGAWKDYLWEDQPSDVWEDYPPHVSPEEVLSALIPWGGILAFFLFCLFLGSQSSEDRRVVEPQESPRRVVVPQESSLSLFPIGLFSLICFGLIYCVFDLLFIPSLSWTLWGILFGFVFLFACSLDLDGGRMCLLLQSSLPLIICGTFFYFFALYFIPPLLQTLGGIVYYSVYFSMRLIFWGICSSIFIFFFSSLFTVEELKVVMTLSTELSISLFCVYTLSLVLHFYVCSFDGNPLSMVKVKYYASLQRTSN